MAAYDATTKALLEAGPADWLAFLGRPDAGPVRLIDADIATVTAAADKVFHVGGGDPWILHLELQSGWDDTLPRRMLLYNAALRERHELPVTSAVVLLRPRAGAPRTVGTFREANRLDGREIIFPFTAIRLWRTPVQTVLAGGPAVLPLAPLADVRAAELPAVIDRIAERLAGLDQTERARTWAATFVLMGLRYDEAFAERLLEEVIGMEESVTYQAIIRKGKRMGHEEGRIEEARRALVRLGTARFGEPSSATRAAVESESDLGRLEEWLDRVLDATGWSDLLGG